MVWNNVLIYSIDIEGKKSIRHIIWNHRVSSVAKFYLTIVKERVTIRDNVLWDTFFLLWATLLWSLQATSCWCPSWALTTHRALFKIQMLAINVKMLGYLRLQMVLIVHFGINEEPAVHRNCVAGARGALLLPLRKHLNVWVHTIIKAQLITLNVCHVLRNWVRVWVTRIFVIEVSWGCLGSRVTFGKFVLQILLNSAFFGLNKSK